MCDMGVTVALSSACRWGSRHATHTYAHTCMHSHTHVHAHTHTGTHAHTHAHITTAIVKGDMTEQHEPRLL